MSAQATAAARSAAKWRPRSGRRRMSGWIFYGLTIIATMLGLIMLAALLD